MTCARGIIRVLFCGGAIALGRPALAQTDCVASGICQEEVETVGDGIDNDGDGIELRWVLADSDHDSTFSTSNELIAVAAGWSVTRLVLGFDFTLETNAMVWYLELGLEGGENDFLGLQDGGSYKGAYPSDVSLTESMDLMVATYGTFPLTVHGLFDGGSVDMTSDVALSCLTANCQDGTRAFGYVQVDWDTLYGLGASQVPAFLEIKLVGIIRADDNGEPADVAPDNTGDVIDTYLVLPIDLDGDGVPDQGFFEDNDGDGFSPMNGDCDDTSSGIHPGASEWCDGIDDDCDGLVPADEHDTDADGYRPCDADCNDAVAAVNPDATEACDGIDNDCDGTIDEGFDADGIGGPDCSDEDGDGYTEWAGDCQDEDSNWFPGGKEWCDGQDNDCDGTIDEGFDADGIGGSDCVDDDGDGVTEDQGDCDDTRYTVAPGRSETCDGQDNDCDGTIDEGFDADGIGGSDCVDDDGDGFSEYDGDCYDEDAFRKPGRPEMCDGIDNNCDGNIDEGFDADGIGGADCTDNDGDGYVEYDGDCNDVDASVHPGAVEQCDGIDNNCDGQVDERFDADGIGGVDCMDNDGDGVTEFAGDCNDENPAQFAGAVEICDGLDNDCDGRVDQGFDEDGDGTSDCVDDDWDGFTENDGDCDDRTGDISPGNDELPGNDIDENCDGIIVDVDGDGYESQDGDCDDENALVSPGEPDVCDGLDNDCDGIIDEGTRETCFDGIDNDCDGLVDEGEPETCNGLDDDCDGRVDNGVRYVASRGVCVTEPGFSCTYQATINPISRQGRSIFWPLLAITVLPPALRRRGRARPAR